MAAVLADTVDQLATMSKTLPEAPDAEQEHTDLAQIVAVEDPAKLLARPPRPPPSPRIFPEAAGRRPPLTEALLKVQRDGYVFQEVHSPIALY